MFKRFFIILLLFNQGLSFSQNDTITNNSEKKLLFYFQEPGFLIPYIESELKKMTRLSQEGIDSKSYFKEVQNFNRFKYNENIQAEMADLVWKQSNASTFINLELTNDKINKEILNTILSYNYFLTIKTNTLGELIEFQFELFETNPLFDKENKGNIRNSTLNNIVKVGNFFINPNNDDYLTKIKNGLYRLFEENNDKPVPRVKIYNDVFSDDFEYYVSIGDTVEISGLPSYDLDTENISYRWKNLPANNQYYQHINKINFYPNEANQNIVISSDSLYYLSFFVDDGINKSKQIKIRLIPVKKPKKTLLISRKFKSFDYNTLTTNQINNDIVAKINIDRDEVNPKLIISKKKIEQRYSAKLHEDDTIGYSYADSLKSKIVSFKSRFNDVDENGNIESRQERTYYLYQISDKELVSKPARFKHEYVKRGLFSFRAGLSVTSFNNRNSSNLLDDTLNLGIPSISSLLEFSLDVTEKFKVLGYFDVGSKISYNEFEFSPQPKLGIGAEYYPFDRFLKPGSIYPFFGLDLGQTIFLENEASFNSNTFSSRAGIEYFFETKYFSLSPGVLLRYGVYNRSVLKNNYFFNMNFVLSFKF